MKLRFKSLELSILLLLFLVVGFTAGYIFCGFSVMGLELVTEKMLLFAAFGIVIPLLVGMYLISRGVVGFSSSSSVRRTTRKKRLHHA